MARRLGSLMLALMVVFTVSAGLVGAAGCPEAKTAHPGHVGHDRSVTPDDPHPAPLADHADTHRICKLTCGTIALMPGTPRPRPVAVSARRVPPGDIGRVRSLAQAPARHPPRLTV